MEAVSCASREIPASADDKSSCCAAATAMDALEESVPPAPSHSEMLPLTIRFPRSRPATMLPVTRRSLCSVPSQVPISTVSPSVILFPSWCSLNLLGCPTSWMISKSPASVVESRKLSQRSPLLFSTRLAEPLCIGQAGPTAGCE